MTTARLSAVKGALIASTLMIIPFHTRAQNDIENVIVETYYISDANDATDVTSGGLAEGSRTYRVYLDLCADCALRAIYGRPDHPLRIESTGLIFNHPDFRGKTYGHQISNTALSEGLVPLDSWLSMGAASNQRFGILKDADTDGSIVGGVNNDGGSAEIPEGLLLNTNPDLGFPLTERDGLSHLGGGSVIPPTFLVVGDNPDSAFKDTTFVNAFVSTNFRMGCGAPGTTGDDQNRILVAQITTTGQLTFELNVEILHPNGDVVRFTALDTLLADDETANGLLTYPPACGCTDPNFLEYDPAAGCDDGSCSTTIVFGCLDPEACNYDPAANFNVNELCCYGPADCNGLDVTLVCPDVGIVDAAQEAHFLVGPNPTEGLLRTDISVPGTSSVVYHLRDAQGRLVMSEVVRTINGKATWMMDLGPLPAGPYHMGIVANDRLMARTIMKQ